MKRLRHHIILVLAVIIAYPLHAQQRDRRVDLKVRCGNHIDLSSSGRLWIATRCGDIFSADSIGSTWRTMMLDEDRIVSGKLFERVAAFGDDIAIAAGYMHGKGYVVRTTTAGALWDTVQVDSNLVWVHGFCYHADGRLWMAASSGRQYKCMAYSTDRGKTFTTLPPPFADTNDNEDGIHELYMVTADSGFAGTFGGKIYSTSDNWRTAHLILSPLNQGLIETESYTDSWVNRIRPWRGMLLATIANTTTYTTAGNIHWQRLPFATYEVDTTSGNLWAITDSGQLLYLTDMEHSRIMAENLSFPHCSIIGILGGKVYLGTPWGVVRISTDGHADTCGFFTEERTLDEIFDETMTEYGNYATQILPTISHGGRLWRSDGISLYLQDALGWYRIAKPIGIRKIHPDPDNCNRVIILRNDGYNYSVDTNGHMEPYTYRHPLVRFLKSGLQGLQITTHVGGCFHYEQNLVTYRRQGDLLRMVENGEWGEMRGEARVADIELALRHLGEVYSQFPTPADFGLQEGDVDLRKVFDAPGGCTSSAGYLITFLNRAGDTLTVRGNSSIDCGDYFPWLLPMTLDYDGVSLVTHQPLLWQALRPLVPKGMMHRQFLNNNSLFDLRAGDLLFFRDTTSMGAAIQESTGKYTHVALVERVDDTVWIIDATQKYGVSQRPLLHTRNGEMPYPDVYRVENGCYNINSVLSRARSFVGQPYDNAFLPNNGALYCSELIYEVFLDDCSAKGKHLFVAKPMNWRDQNGQMPTYWINHFKKLGMPVPEGIPGTNPTDMARSSRLKPISTR